MLKINIKIKKIFNLMFFFSKKKKKKIILGPIGNYSYKLLNKKIKKKNFFFIKNIKKLFFNCDKIIPYKNNNGGIVNDTIKLLKNKKIFIKIVFILNINHNFFIYKKKKKFFFHNQSKKQTIDNIKKNFLKFKKKIINSNSEINNGFIISNSILNNALTIFLKKINLKDNIFNKTIFISNFIFNIKKKILMFFCNNNKKFILFIKKYIFFLYNNKNDILIECYFKSLRMLCFIMKYFKNKIKIFFSGFYNIL